MTTPEAAGELPPRPAVRGAKGFLRPSPATAQAWQNLVGHPLRCEIAITIIGVVSIPFTVIAALKFGTFLAGGLVTTGFTILGALISIWLYSKSNLTPVSSLIRSLVFLIAWLITSFAARVSYYNYWNSYLDDNFDNPSPGDVTTPSLPNGYWMIAVRSVFYWGLCVVFFVYMVLSAVGVHRERQVKRRQVYGMQAGPGGAPPGYYAQAGPGVLAGPGGGSYVPPVGPPPQGRFA